jgi:uncharacterized protein YbjT (DUF2867 family)
MVREAGIPYTIQLTVFFMDNFIDPQYGTETMLRVILGYLKPETKLHVIATEDIGTLAVQIFDNPADYLDQALEVAGDIVTKRQLAETYRRITGIKRLL